MADPEPEPKKKPSNVPKTPVSLLQEIYVRKGITPHYALVQVEGEVHEPTYKYRVTIGPDLVATGSGLSKKKAKHSAAKAMIDKLKALSQGKGLEHIPSETSTAIVKAVAAVPSFEVIDMASSFDDGIEGNPVGELQELCMNRRLKPPIYSLSQEEGAPHERLFIMACSAGDHYIQTGTAKSKKLAKRQAASKMLNILKMIPADNDEGLFRIDEDDLAQGIVTAASKEQNKLNPFQQLNKFHRNLKLSKGHLLASLHDPEKFKEILETDPKQTLEDIGAEQDFSVTFVPIEEKSRDNKFHCFVQLTTTPVAVCFGDGETEELAERECSKSSLDYLKLMTIP